MSHDVVLKNDGKDRHQSQECHCLIRTDGLDNVYGEFTFEIYGWNKSEILKNLGNMQDLLNKELYSIRKKVEESIANDEKERENAT